MELLGIKYKRCVKIELLGYKIEKMCRNGIFRVLNGKEGAKKRNCLDIKSNNYFRK